VDVEHCDNCSGIWFDKGKLERIRRLGGRNAIRALSLEHVDLTQDGRRDWQLIWYDEQQGECPRCFEVMSRRESDEQPELYLDHCEVCGGVWFDGGEVEDLLGADGPGLAAWLLGLLKRSA